ncbi:MAG: class I SAM-dependent methyltransferase [Solirubrobacterales bacterium]|nr:class I SAM-dependent methyltransferase [Solirubrobacterales bacterium]
MNLAHNLLCASGWWGRRVERELLPWGLEDCDLGDDVLEIGPGFGKTTRLLAARLPRLTVVELEPRYCRRLAAELGSTVAVVQGDATELPFPDARFTAVVCFTMLHHVPTLALQDRVFAEVARVLRPGGTFAGTDSIGAGALFKLIHIGDVLRPVEPDALPARLEAAGLRGASVARGGRSFRFRVEKAPA